MSLVMVAVKAKNLRVGDRLTICDSDTAPRVVEIEEIDPPSYGSIRFGVEIKGGLDSFSFKPNDRVVVFR